MVVDRDVLRVEVEAALAKEGFQELSVHTCKGYVSNVKVMTDDDSGC